MDFRRRIRALEKKLDVGERREGIIELGNDPVLRISSERLTKLLQEIQRDDDLLPPCEQGD